MVRNNDTSYSNFSMNSIFSTKSNSSNNFNKNALPDPFYFPNPKSLVNDNNTMNFHTDLHNFNYIRSDNSENSMFNSKNLSLKNNLDEEINKNNISKNYDQFPLVNISNYLVNKKQKDNNQIVDRFNFLDNSQENFNNSFDVVGSNSHSLEQQDVIYVRDKFFSILEKVSKENIDNIKSILSIENSQNEGNFHSISPKNTQFIGLSDINDKKNPFREIYDLLSKYSLQNIVFVIFNIIDEFMNPILTFDEVQKQSFESLNLNQKGSLNRVILEQSFQFTELTISILKAILEHFSFMISIEQFPYYLDLFISRVYKVNNFNIREYVDPLSSESPMNMEISSQLEFPTYSNIFSNQKKKIKYQTALIHASSQLILTIDDYSKKQEILYCLFKKMIENNIPEKSFIPILFLQDTFHILKFKILPLQIELIMSLLLQEQSEISLQFILTLLTNYGEEDESLDDYNSCENTNREWKSFSENIIKQLLYNLSRRDIVFSNRFVELSMEIINEYVSYNLEDSLVSSILILLLNLFSNPSYSLETRYHIMNTLFSNVIPFYPSIVSNLNAFESSLQLCLHFMSENKESFQRGIELLEVSLTHIEGKEIPQCCLTFTEAVISSPDSSILMKVASLGILKCVSGISSNYQFVLNNASRILKIIENSLASEIESIRQEALLTLCKSIHILKEIPYSHFKFLMDSILGSMQHSNIELQLAILEAISTIDFKSLIPFDKREVHESLPTKIVLHLMRFYTITKDSKIQFEVLSCISTIINQFISFDWQGISDQILSFLLKIIQTTDNTSFQFQLKRLAIECFDQASFHLPKERTRRYIPEIMKEFESLLNKYKDSEILDTILSFFSCATRILKSETAHFLPFILRTVKFTLSVSDEERVMLKKLKYSSQHNRTQERCYAFESLKSILKDLPFRCIQNFINIITDILSQFEKNIHLFNNEKLSIHSLETITILYTSLIENPVTFNGKRKNPHTENLSLKKRKISEFESKSLKTYFPPKEQIDILPLKGIRSDIIIIVYNLIINSLKSIFGSSVKSLEEKLFALKQLNYLSCNPKMIQNEYIREEFINCVRTILDSNFITDLPSNEQISSSARLLEVCQSLQCLNTMKESIMKLAVNVLTMVTMGNLILGQNNSDLFNLNAMETGFLSPNEVSNSNYELSNIHKNDLNLVQSFVMGEF